ncbi:amidohydrolase family protein [Sabulilitoribacter arenilitoris]|uniref:Amidohydrolase family protein n=1 Tax=Wocania arenilitoris TaxID=2044858 RepID=A0AAE3EMS4_9FLAO|nr:amidohydrolase family protein [Wocania arenilitoris]MCF7567866.1 amidohydrolase family protein [Wocania arenilitoris]
MKIDAHQHFWKFDPIRDAWIDESMQIIRKDFLPKDLKPILKQNDIDGCVAIQADQSETETEFLLDCAAKNSFIKGVVGWVDLRAENVESRLEFYSKNTLFKGVRHIVQAEANDFMLGKDFQNGISKLEQFNLTYDILIFPPQIESAIDLVNKFPNQKFVIDHIAKPYIRLGKIDNWKTKMIELSKAQNVYCKVSGMVTEADLKHWKTSDFTPYLDVIFSTFGTDRILYGSDWPVCLLAAKYEQQLQLVQDYIKGFSENDKTKILGSNAIKFYNLL